MYQRKLHGSSKHNMVSTPFNTQMNSAIIVFAYLRVFTIQKSDEGNKDLNQMLNISRYY
jgi:hypothetical protein